MCYRRSRTTLAACLWISRLIVEGTDERNEITIQTRNCVWCRNLDCVKARGCKLALLSEQKPFRKGDLHPMAKIIPIDEHFQHFLSELKESFWGDLYGQTRQAWQKFFELQSER